MHPPFVLLSFLLIGCLLNCAQHLFAPLHARAPYRLDAEETDFNFVSVRPGRRRVLHLQFSTARHPNIQQRPHPMNQVRRYSANQSCTLCPVSTSRISLSLNSLMSQFQKKKLDVPCSHIFYFMSHPLTSSSFSFQMLCSNKRVLVGGMCLLQIANEKMLLT